MRTKQRTIPKDGYWNGDDSLETQIAEARKSRDEWCAEYVRVRDELEAIKADLAFYKALSLKPATYAIGSGAL